MPKTILFWHLQSCMRIKVFITGILVLSSLGIVNAWMLNHPSAKSVSSTTEQTNDTIPKRNLHGKGRRINPYPIVLQKFFTHVWKGYTICNGDTTKIPSELTVTGKDSVDVYVSGLIHHKSKLSGAVRGYMIIVESQKIRSPKGEHLVEGTFILSNDFNSLTGNYTNKLNGKTDTCTAVYHPVQ